MARSRNIKPGFFKNEHLVELAFEVRLLFIGLWTMADREGYLEDRPKRIKMEIFPADDVDVEDGLQDLEKAGFIKRYMVGKDAYIHICNFLEHQNPHHKEVASTIPKPNTSTNLTANTSIEKPGQTPTKAGVSPADSLIPESKDTVPSGTGAIAPRDPVKDEIWKTGKQLLVENSGLTTEKAGVMLGKLIKDHGQVVILDAVRHCMRESIADPLTYLLAMKRAEGKQADLERRNDEAARQWLEGSDARH